MINDSIPLTTPDIEVITNVLFSQIMSVMGLKRPNFISRILFLLLNRPVKRISGMLVELDHNIALKGCNQATKEFMGYFVTNVEIRGAENIPENGPLLLMCNHPAAYDAIILAAYIRRDDLKVLGSDIEIIKKFPNIANLIIPVPYEIASRLKTVRLSIQHLKNGGALLIFPRGNVEPDPAVSPGAEDSLKGWSASLELFLRQVPQTISVVAIASGVLSEKWFKNPLIKLWKKYEQRQKVAEIFQVATQLITGKKSSSTPLVSFSRSLTIEDLGGVGAPGGSLLASLVEQAQKLLADHPHR
jgi:1-acyl-sn-glycerol-3-phosphate acyltransferase